MSPISRLSDPALARYDEDHLVTYLCMLDANADAADWREVSRIVLHIDAEREPDRARRTYDMSAVRRGPDMAHVRMKRRE